MKLSPARVLLAIVAIGLASVTTLSFAGFNGGGGGNRVGGVSIDPAGVVRAATVQENQEFINLLRASVPVAKGGLAQAAETRMISLKGIQAAIETARQGGGRLPADVRFLAGLTSIEYVYVDQQNQDIVIAGPAEPWKIGDDGSIVGTKTGAAVLHLEDLIVALRNVDNSRHGGISVSIEPTAEGRDRLQKLLRRVTLKPGQNPAVIENAMKQAFGPQQVKFNGIPTDSRYAATLVAADYEMKRLAMALEDSPVKELPSYLSMARNARHSSVSNPRWWIECAYDSLTRNEAGTAWKLSGQGVKTLTEDEVVNKSGQLESTGRNDQFAQKWADAMTANYVELAAKKPIFGELQNLMDLTVVATLIAQESLESKSGLQLTVFRDNDLLSPVSYDTPRTISPECSFIRGNAGWVVTASGGVSINPFQLITEQQVDAGLEQVASVGTADAWWWNK